MILICDDVKPYIGFTAADVTGSGSVGICEIDAQLCQLLLGTKHQSLMKVTLEILEQLFY